MVKEYWKAKNSKKVLHEVKDCHTFTGRFFYPLEQIPLAIAKLLFKQGWRVCKRCVGAK